MVDENNNTGDNNNGSDPITVICGANTRQLDDINGHSVTEVGEKMREILNIGQDHTVVIVNGKQVNNPASYLLFGGEEVEFKKTSGQKGPR